MSTVLTMTAALAAPATQVAFVDYYRPVEAGEDPVFKSLAPIAVLMILAVYGITLYMKAKKKARERATFAMKQARESREQTRFEWEQKDRENGLSQKSYKSNDSYKNKNSYKGKPYKNKKKNYKK